MRRYRSSFTAAGLVAMLASACFNPSTAPLADDAEPEPPGDGESPMPLADAGVDADVDALGNGGMVCRGGFLSICVEPPLLTTTLTSQTIDTSASPLCGVYTATPAIDACVIARQSITIPANHTVTAIGRRPLILLSTGSITISGVLDAASHNGRTAGPGADTGPCSTNVMNPTAGPAGDGGGGGGGSFGGAGNNGGNGAIVGTSGIAAPGFATTTLRGGCTGSDGAGNGGGGGSGGGAVMLLAAQTVAVDGTINASGASGSGGTGSSGGGSGGGGGGGGSRGMIVLDAAAVNINGPVLRQRRRWWRGREPHLRRQRGGRGQRTAHRGQRRPGWRRVRRRRRQRRWRRQHGRRARRRRNGNHEHRRRWRWRWRWWRRRHQDLRTGAERHRRFHEGLATSELRSHSSAA